MKRAQCSMREHARCGLMGACWSLWRRVGLVSERPTAEEVKVDPTAVVEPGALVGAGTRIWHHAHVRTGAVIGERCVLGKGVFIDSGAVLGDECKVQNNVSVYAGVRLESKVFVGPSAVFTNDRYPRADGSAWHLVQTIVRAGASIGANATVICGLEVGQWAVVAAGAVVTHDVQAHELVAGNPARRLGWVCFCGRVLLRTDAGSCPVMTCGHCGRGVERGEQ